MTSPIQPLKTREAGHAALMHPHRKGLEGEITELLLPSLVLSLTLSGKSGFIISPLLVLLTLPTSGVFVAFTLCGQ